MTHFLRFGCRFALGRCSEDRLETFQDLNIFQSSADVVRAGSDLSEALVLDARLHAPQERINHEGEKRSTQRAPLEDTAKDPESQLRHAFAG